MTSEHETHGTSPSRSSPEAEGPGIFVLARPVFEQEAALDFLRSEDATWDRTPGSTPAERAVEFAGRICYMSFGARQSPRQTREYIRNLITQGHESVLEHVAWTFLITGVSRSFTHQLVRHRIGFSYSQLSQQYHDERQARTVVPTVIADDQELHGVWSRVASESMAAYEQFLDALDRRDRLEVTHDGKERMRLIRTAARGILPANTATKIVVSANARALRHFLSLRGALLGDDEMRQVSVALFNVLREDAPSIFEDFRVEAAPDGACILRLTDSSPKAGT